MARKKKYFEYLTIPIRQSSAFMVKSFVRDLRKARKVARQQQYLEIELEVIKKAAKHMNLHVAEFIRRVAIYSSLEIVPHEQWPFYFQRGNTKRRAIQLRAESRRKVCKLCAALQHRDPRTGRYRENYDLEGGASGTEQAGDAGSGSSSDGESS